MKERWAALDYELQIARFLPRFPLPQKTHRCPDPAFKTQSPFAFVPTVPLLSSHHHNTTTITSSLSSLSVVTNAQTRYRRSLSTRFQLVYVLFLVVPDTATSCRHCVFSAAHFAVLLAFVLLLVTPQIRKFRLCALPHVLALYCFCTAAHLRLVILLLVNSFLSTTSDQSHCFTFLALLYLLLSSHFANLHSTT